MKALYICIGVVAVVFAMSILACLKISSDCSREEEKENGR